MVVGGSLAETSEGLAEAGVSTGVALGGKSWALDLLLDRVALGVGVAGDCASAEACYVGTPGVGEGCRYRRGRNISAVAEVRGVVGDHNILPETLGVGYDDFFLL